MNPTDLVDRASLRDDIPDFAPGDTVKVHVRVVEGNRRAGPGVPGRRHPPQGQRRCARPSPSAR